MKIFLMIIFVSLTPFSFGDPANDSKTFYVINYSWHTGFILEWDELLAEKIPAAASLKEYQFVDIGWGDEEFYQTPGIDYYLAAKAVLIPTSSAVRIAGYKFDLELIKTMSDYLVEFKVGRKEYLKLLNFIDDSFEKNETEELFLLSESSNGRIKFFASHRYYHLFNTCNTWIAEGLNRAGLNVRTSLVVQSEDLFEEIKTIGNVKGKN